jgi:hypothetical protein
MATQRQNLRAQTKARTRTLSANIPFHRRSTLFTTPDGVNNVDDAKVVHHMERLVPLVCRPDPILILVKEKMLLVACVHLRQDSISDTLQIRIHILVHCPTTHHVQLLHSGRRSPPPV